MPWLATENAERNNTFYWVGVFCPCGLPIFWNV